MKNLEIKIPVINNTPDAIKTGKLVYIETKKLYVFLWGKYRKYRWYHRLFLKTPVEVGMVRGVDTRNFKDGERLYLDPNNAGGLISR